MFPQMQLLDFAGPYDVFTTSNHITVHLIGETLEPIKTTNHIRLNPQFDCNTVPKLDILCIPGGKGVNALLENETVLKFIQSQAQTTHYISSICTGSLVLGAAGVLKGYKATSHWSAVEYLPYFSAIPKNDRVVIDKNIITAGGITAGIDFGLFIIQHLISLEEAQKVQLILQYDPHPPLDCGTPEKAPQNIVKDLKTPNFINDQSKRIAELFKKNHETL
ncbi:DJ-1/PfpI family protein [Bartonella tamiae]|uniref:DJ-1/PfpI family protein n=1 Tax=Bartonella tamiae TaxID=373638 RepID=UPI002473AF56|nr:DJ-1/PfpI family protein [Bartonella tamiae]